MSLFEKASYKIAGIILLLIITAGIGVYYYLNSLKEPEQEIPFTEPEPVIVKEYGLPVDSFSIVRGKIKQGQNFSLLLQDFKVTGTLIEKIVRCADTILDLRKIKAGKKYTAFCANDSTNKLLYFVYEHSPAEYVMFNLNDTINVIKEQKEIITKEISASATIQSSLWKTMQDNDINVEVAILMSDIYAWTIDFFEIHKNDKFKVIYEEHFVDTISLGVAKIIGTCFTHNGKDYYAFPFEQNDKIEYFDENGKNLRKAFLKAPLKFFRITSKFSNARLHPVLKVYRPHHGVDYAAPVGTPVHTIGIGKVISMGYQGGAGNMVKIKHSNNYVTTYMHLSGYAKGIKVGNSVSQGQVIGYVGSTGLSTGPHLDFRVHINGRAVNPLKMESPPAEPVNNADKAQFENMKNKIIKQLNRIKI
ncbi:MAG: hypothetical protein A2275_15705 [Bacteroidetes bacterium RIFOXYA12_FULL_35_11]|nr:MAG: hypothetical protein A2X01_21675 [Bacteroidetes bacterium GWF2_35_48]OFY79609.1 MAG: hypothetical protein A2275_15705 [Bacteroidetes bacterium RIFOXYA12_FULL_35_11]OFY93316.1 MAG: hypothetical protein A2491_14640 [Bacteroidetes bacterium RIFOXYC12_FULL_35_7]HBX50561.1 metalloendopeptidase [Bacteroidales bacterium]